MIFFRIFSLLPFPLLYLLSDLLYLVVYYVVKYRLKVVRENLKNSFPEKTEQERRQIEKQFYKNLCDIVFETIKSLTISQKEFERRNKILNPELVENYLDNGRHIIGLTGHFCNWEWLLLINSLKVKYPIDAVYRPLLSPFFDKLMLKLRTRFGAFPVPMKETLRYFARRKDIVRGIAMVADQSPYFTEIQYATTFLNQDTPFFLGGQKLAIRAGYPVVYIGMRRLKRGHYEVFYKKIAEPPYEDNNDIVETYKDMLEEDIKSHPADWLWTHKRWKYSQAWKDHRDRKSVA